MVSQYEQVGSDRVGLSRAAELGLATLAAVLLVAISALLISQLAGDERPLWPMPMFILVQLPALGILALSIAVSASKGVNLRARWFQWLAIGALGGGAFLGMFSVGFLASVPIALLFVSAVSGGRPSDIDSYRFGWLPGSVGFVANFGILLALALSTRG